MTDETRARFIASIAAQVPADRVAEVHLFSAIKQGGMESGVAVIAVERAPRSVDVDGGDVQPEAVADAAVVESADSIVVNDQLSDEAAFVADELPGTGEEPVVTPPAIAPSRYTIYTARYRHTLKGIDRGKWEVSVTEEAEAPLLTLDAVVRGVQRRSGDVEEIMRLNGDEFRALLPVTQPA